MRSTRARWWWAGVGLLAWTLGIGTVACDDSSSPPPGGADLGVGDLAALPVEDLGGPDLRPPADLQCGGPVYFAGFGLLPTEQKIECRCGCVIDPFTNNVIAGFWGTPIIEMATLTPTVNGLVVNVSPGAGGAGVGALSSAAGTIPFYLAGDFDLSVEYELPDVLPPDAHAILRVAAGGANVYIIERERGLDGVERYKATLGGVQPVSRTSSATRGTLRLQRSGFTLRAEADGQLVSQFTGATLERLPILVTAGLSQAGCDVAGGARPDAGTCAATVIWRNLQLRSGTLVDRP
jgi:hypothetical protein